MIEDLTWLLARWWWLVVAPAVVAAVLAFVWVSGQPDYYVSTGTYVVQPRQLDASNQLRVIQALINTEGINETYANIASSRLLEDRALAMLDLEGRDTAGLDTTAAVVSGTNILEIGARGRDPELVEQMAAAVGTTTVEYVNDLDDVVFLSTLDGPTTPGSPTGRATGLVTTAALIVGLAVGVAVARGAEHAFPVTPRVKIRSIRDQQSNAFSRRYFKHRVREEISRSRSVDHMFSVGVLQVKRPGSQGAEADEPAPLAGPDLSTIAADIRSTLRDHDVLGHLRRGRFAAILPGMSVDDAQVLVQDWKRVATKSLLDRPLGGDVAITVGVCSYDSSAFVGDEVAERMVSDL